MEDGGRAYADLSEGQAPEPQGHDQAVDGLAHVLPVLPGQDKPAVGRVPLLQPLQHAVLIQRAVAAMASGSPVGEAEFGERMRDEDTFAAFISGRNEDDFESAEGWYRWSCQVEALDKDGFTAVVEPSCSPTLLYTW